MGTGGCWTQCRVLGAAIARGSAGGERDVVRWDRFAADWPSREDAVDAVGFALAMALAYASAERQASGAVQGDSPGELDLRLVAEALIYGPRELMAGFVPAQLTDSREASATESLARLASPPPPEPPIRWMRLMAMAAGILDRGAEALAASGRSTTVQDLYEHGRPSVSD